MRIIVKAKPGSKQEKIEKITQPSFNFGDKDIELDIYKVWVKEPPVQGRANVAISKLLAEYFNVSPSQVRLVSGASSKQKIFEILK